MEKHRKDNADIVHNVEHLFAGRPQWISPVELL
jgi:hypothetical protein